MSVKRPVLLGKITENIVYKRIHPSVLSELKRLNPKNESGNRTRRHHQFLTDDIGNPHLEKHIASLVTLMRISPEWLRFMRHVERAFPIQNGQLTIGYPDMDEDDDIDK
jgi:P63C domain